MAGKQSAGLLLHRRHQGVWQVFLVHPGGPFWKAKDLGAWSIPKGEFEAGEDPLEAAKREFREETGLVIEPDAIALTPIKQTGGKLIHAWQWRETATRARSGAICSRSSGRRAPAECASSPRSTVATGSGWMSREVTMGQRGFVDQLRALLPPEGLRQCLAP